MIRTSHTIKTVGIQAVPIVIETSIDKGIGIHVVGISDQQTRESLLRTVTALQANGYRIPGKRIIINIAPSDLHKEGLHYDLPMALSVIAASELDNGLLADLEKFIVLGELGLDGSVRPVSGAFEAVRAAKENGFKGCIIPEGNLPAFIELLDEQMPVYPVNSLQQAIAVIAKPENAMTAGDWYENLLQEKPDLQGAYQIRPSEVWDNITGNDGAKRAVEIAAAGGHPLLLIGAPGSGKAMLANSLRNLLPPMTKDEAETVASIYSIANYESRRYTDAKRRPMRTPHVSCSLAAMLGGGCGENIRPGEVSLAQGGVLFLDGFCSAPKSLIEGLRGPLEDKKVVISRLKSKTEYPSDFQLVAATEPCPCGYYGEGDRCTCTAGQRAAYLARLSGPIYERLTIQAYCHIPAPGAKHTKGEGFQEVYGRVQNAIAIQKQRFANEPYKTNDEIPAKDIEKYCPLSGECKDLLEKIFTRLGLSARAYTRIIRIARTIADLAGSDSIKDEHIAEAASFRFLDRKNIPDEILTAEHQAS